MTRRDTFSEMPSRPDLTGSALESAKISLGFTAYDVDLPPVALPYGRVEDDPVILHQMHVDEYISGYEELMVSAAKKNVRSNG